MTILVIEDNEEIRENTVELLELEGFKVRVATDGRSGLESALSDPPHLILCDIMMPELSGHEVLVELKRNGHTAEIPFIFFTANFENRDVNAGMKLGANGYISKPFDANTLLQEIRKWVDP